MIEAGPYFTWLRYDRRRVWGQQVDVQVPDRRGAAHPSDPGELKRATTGPQDFGWQMGSQGTGSEPLNARRVLGRDPTRGLPMRPTPI